MSIDQRLAELGITLPQPAAPVASYVPAVEQGGLLHISGQISFAEDGNLILGRLFSVGTVSGVGASARITKYYKAYPGVHVDGVERWLYPIPTPGSTG